MSKSESLCEELAYWEFEATPFPHIVLWDGSISAGAELLPLDIECFDESRINALALGLRSFVNSLPEGLTCQFVASSDSNFAPLLRSHIDLVSTGDGFLQELDAARTNGLMRDVEERTSFATRLFLFLMDRPSNTGAGWTLGPPKRFAADASEFEPRLQAISQAIDGAKNALASLGFHTADLDRDELISMAYRHLNPRRAHTVGAPVIRESAIAIEGESPRSQLVFGDLILDREDFILDSERTRVITLKTLPETTFAGQMSAFLSFPFPFEAVFSFQIPEQSKEMRSLEQKRRIAHSLSHSTGARVSDLESESRLSQTTDLIREIIETGQRIFMAELVVILRDEADTAGKRRLDMKSKEVLARFRSLSGSEGCQETVGSWKVFKSELPGAPISLIRGKRLKTNNLVDFLPLYGPSLGDKKAVAIAHTRTGSLYSFDPFDEKLTNYNMLVTGSSGSGKSFANNFLLLQQIARGTKAFVIDIGGSYRKLARALGGQCIDIALDSGHVVNPLECGGFMPSGERLKALVAIVEQMTVDEGVRFSRFDRVQVEEALTKTFAVALESGSGQSPLLSDFTKLCLRSEEDSLRRIGKLLFPWTGDSPYGRLLDRPGGFKADSPIVAFDLKGLSQHPDLQSVMILILTNFILSEVEGDRSRPKRVLLDEAWALLKSPAASGFMEYAARTFRKTGSGITFITQGVEEIASSGIGSAIFNNTATKLIMLQRGDTRVLQEALKLNSQELRLIQSLEQRKGLFSEGFLMAGESRQVIRIQPSALEYWISTSDAQDNIRLATLEQQTGSLKAALKLAALQSSRQTAAREA